MKKQKQFIRDVNLKKITVPCEDDNEDMMNITELRKVAKQKTDEKIAITEQTLELVESFVRKMDTDLTIFETLLRGSGEFETIGAQVGNDVCPIDSYPSRRTKMTNF